MLEFCCLCLPIWPHFCLHYPRNKSHSKTARNICPLVAEGKSSPKGATMLQSLAPSLTLAFNMYFHVHLTQMVTKLFFAACRRHMSLPLLCCVPTNYFAKGRASRLQCSTISKTPTTRQLCSTCPIVVGGKVYDHYYYFSLFSGWNHHEFTMPWTRHDFDQAKMHPTLGSKDHLPAAVATCCCS